MKRVVAFVLSSLIVGCGGLADDPSFTAGKGDGEDGVRCAGCIDASGVCVEIDAQHSGLCGGYGMACASCSDSHVCDALRDPVTFALTGGGKCTPNGQMLANYCVSSTRLVPLPVSMPLGSPCKIGDEWGTAAYFD